MSFDQAGHQLDQFWSPFLHPGHARIEEDLNWNPTAVVAPFPEGPNVKWAPAPVAVLTAVPPDLLHNVG